MSRYVNIMTKVSPETAARLDRIKEVGAFSSRYEVVQAAVGLMLKYADPGGEILDPEQASQSEALRQLFGDVSAVRYNIARVKPNGGRKIEPSEVIAFYGKECLMLQVLDASGSSTTTTNQRDILEVVLTKTLPTEVLQRLRSIRKEGGCTTLFGAIMALVKGATVEGLTNEVADLFKELSESDPRTVKLGIENKPARAKAKRNFDR